MSQNEETTTFEASAYSGDGRARERVALPPSVFDGTVNMPVMHLAVKVYLANQRQGTAATKTRGLVTGGNQKPWRQKGTGRARQGSTRAPNWVGGGTVFGPQPRDYRLGLPRQVRSLARKSAFNARARENAIFIIDPLGYDAPKTSRMKELLTQLGIADRKVLLLTDGVSENVFLSARNLPSVQVMPYEDASTYHILWSDIVLIEAPAFGEPLTATGPIADSPEAAPRRKTAKAAKKAKKAGGADDEAVGAEEIAAAGEGEEKAPARARKTAGAAKKAGGSTSKKGEE
jgi:large subunit ribosomal protein L4